VPFTSVYAGKYRTEDKLKTDITKTKHNPEKANNTTQKKQNKTTLVQSPFTTRGKKHGGLILRCSRAHMGPAINAVSEKKLFSIKWC